MDPARALRLIAAFGLLLLHLPAARASERGGGPKPIKIAILDVRVSGPIDPKRLEGLSNVLVAEASRHARLQVVSSQDVKTMLGFEAQRQLLSCGDSGCLTEIGGALGVSYILSTEVSRIGSVWVLTANLLDMNQARAAHRASRRAKDEDALVDAAVSALDEALAAIPGLTPEAVASASGSHGGGAPAWLRWTLRGGGAAVLVAGGVLYGLAAGTASAWNSHDAAVSPDQARTARDVFQPAGIGLFVGGAALVAGSFLLPARDRPALQVNLDPASGTATAALTFRIE